MQQTSIIVPVVASITIACTTTVVEPFYRPPTAQVDYSFVSPNADFEKYKQLLLSPLEIYYPDSVAEPAQADLDRLRQYFRDAFIAALGDDYRVAVQPAPDALRVNAQVIDLKIVGAGGTYQPSVKLREAVAAGELTFLMELEDAATGMTLARAADNTGTPELAAVAGEEPSWDHVQAAAQRWASLFRAFLDRNMQGARRS